MQVIGKELFGLLRETHGKRFHSFIEEKVVPLAGDIIHENLGVEGPQLRRMTRELNVIVNGAATTNFYERYTYSVLKMDPPPTYTILNVRTYVRTVLQVRRGPGRERDGSEAYLPVGQAVPQSGGRPPCVHG
jgi:hypothetical protein